LRAKNRVSLIFPLIIIIVCVVSCEKQKTGWKGSIEEIDGIPVVNNPKEPLYGEDAFILEEELSIGEAAGKEEYMFSEIVALAADAEERIYVLDYEECNVKIFDGNGRFIQSFGRQGQGPGELYLPRTVSIASENEIAVQDNRGISFFSMGGEFQRSLSTAKYLLSSSLLDNDGNIIGVEIVRDEENPRYELKKFDSDVNYLHSFDSSPLSNFRRDGFNPFFPTFRWTVINGDQIVFGYMGEYELKVFDPEGNLIRKISKEYTPVKVTQKDVDERLEGEELPPQILEKMVVPEYHCPIQRISADDEGRIFVMTYERAPDGSGYYYDIFDAEGRFIVKVPLKSRPLLMQRRKLFTVEEDEEGYQHVKRYRITWRI